MPRNPLNPHQPTVWTEAEDKALLENFAKLGPMGLKKSGLVAGKSYNQIRGRRRQLLGFRQAERDVAPREMRPVKQFNRQHASVWGYARTVGATA
jgi:monomeric isocitrate dehydrogenase